MKRADIDAELQLAVCRAVQAYVRETRLAALVQAGWRLCPHTGGRGHVWNAHTTALALFDQPSRRGLRRVACHWHRQHPR